MKAKTGWMLVLVVICALVLAMPVMAMGAAEVTPPAGEVAEADVAGTLVVIFALSFLAESLVEFMFGTPFEKFTNLTQWKWVLMYIALVVGIALAIIYKIDLIHILSTYLKVPIDSSIVGQVLTGYMIGRGSNYLHNFVKTFFPGVVKPVDNGSAS